MIQPKISVVTVCYNAVNDIEKTILSVVNQTYPNIEYLIIDGGSTDGTMDVVNKYRDKIDVIVSEPDKGIYDAMNKGIKLATGEWLNMMNAGDVFTNDTILDEVFREAILEEVTFLYGDVVTFDKRGREFVWKTNFDTHNLCHQAIIYRKSLHYEHGFYIVTPKPIISDSLFEMRVPSSQVKRLNLILAIYEGGGISDANWVVDGLFATKVLYRKMSMTKMYLSYLMKRGVLLFPIELRRFVKTLVGRSKNEYRN